MEKVKNIIAREIIDSRGYPTIECDVFLDNNIIGRSSVPSGASTGTHEAFEVRDGDKKRFLGKGVLKPIEKINNIIKENLCGFNIFDQNEIDNKLIELDGSENKSNLGANATLAVSLSCAKAASISKNLFLYEYLGDQNSNLLPVPLINIINGGKHGDNKIDFQEFMIAPIGANSFREAIQMGSEIFHILKKNLSKKGLNTNVGDEGGFGPDLRSAREALELILESVNDSGYKYGSDIYLALDIASTEFYNDNNYNLIGENKILSSIEFSDYLINLVKDYPIFSIEDGMSEDDFNGWKYLTNHLGKKIQLVGDDLFVTNFKRLKMGIEENLANSILIKLNQIGTLSETINVVNLASENSYNNIISHRSGETEDTTISDLSVALKTGQIKTGSLSRTDRLAKYNQLLRIEEKLGNQSIYAGNDILKFKK